MTRVNTICTDCYLSEDLHEKLDMILRGEYKEISRIFTLAYEAEKRGFTPETYGIPDKFTLNKGHMKFFSNKLKYIEKRYLELVDVMQAKGYTVNFPTLQGKNRPSNPEWYNDWVPSEDDIALSWERINLRLSGG